ncbi:periplasmic nitrate reductase, NapE protein [Vreelandella massiliensis]|uniref:periplasmic nitrate reductase, NapE protein n=1 Tax=Vreelandella massiliensis TaxID=1816686 RepID=UPI00096A5D37|nr:periplasmic nitrate reductase, NapE protein [Halomonas massiliensis]MYL23590.1 periplasmic nitrate reductase, NapE protein [Halomonas alkaliantarctica]
MSDSNSGMASDNKSLKAKELKLFLFIIILLFPILAVGVVGGYGFAVWIFQMFAGPPGPPA